MTADSKSPEKTPPANNRRRTILLALVVVALLAFGLYGPTGDEPAASVQPLRRPKRPAKGSVPPVTVSAVTATPTTVEPAPGTPPTVPATEQVPSADVAEATPRPTLAAPIPVPAAGAPAPADVPIADVPLPTQPEPVATTTAPPALADPATPALEPPRELPDGYATPDPPKPGSIQSPMEQYREPGPEPPAPLPTTILAKIRRYADSVIARWDADGDRRLSVAEWRAMPGDPSSADLNGDGQLDAQEIAARVAVYSRRRLIRLMPGRIDPEAQPAEGDAAAAAPPQPVAPTDGEPSAAAAELARRARQYYVPDQALPAGLPQWFVASDGNGDAQVSMAEFSAQWSDADLDRFRQYDLDGDGLITVAESLAAGRGEAPAGQAAPTDSVATP